MIATLLGIDLLSSVLALGLFFLVGSPFGAINDWTIGMGGLLSALLVVTVARSTGSGFGVTTMLGIGGSVIVVLGAALVISRTTGFLLAGLVESFGFALLGMWLIVLNWSRANRFQILGLAAGALMSIGVVVVPAIVAGVDNPDTAPAYVWLGFVGWLGIFVLYPVWTIWFGQVAEPGRSATH